MQERSLSTNPAADASRSSELLALSEAAPLLGLSNEELVALIEHADFGLRSLNGQPAVTLQDLVHLRGLPELRRGSLKALRAAPEEAAASAPQESSGPFELKLLRIQHEQVSERFEVLRATFREQSDELEELREELALSQDRVRELQPAESKLATTCAELGATRAELADALNKITDLERVVATAVPTLAERTSALSERDAELAHARAELARSDEGWRLDRARFAEEKSTLEQRLEARTRELEGLRRDADLAAARHANELALMHEALAEVQARNEALELSERSLSRYADKLEQRLAAREDVA